jgi:hypothetical protein
LTENTKPLQDEGPEPQTLYPGSFLDGKKDERKGTLSCMGESTGEENSNLHIRGVNEGRSGELLEPSDLLDILEVFGEDGMRSYLMGIIEGEEDAAEDEEDFLEEDDEDRE